MPYIFIYLSIEKGLGADKAGAKKVCSADCAGKVCSHHTLTNIYPSWEKWRLVFEIKSNKFAVKENT